MARKYYAQMTCLKDISIALPDRDLAAKKGDTVTVELRIARILKKSGYAKITGVVCVEEE